MGFNELAAPRAICSARFPVFNAQLKVCSGALFLFFTFDSKVLEGDLLQVVIGDSYELLNRSIAAWELAPGSKLDIPLQATQHRLDIEVTVTTPEDYSSLLVITASQREILLLRMRDTG